MLRATVNNQAYEFGEGLTILEALREIKQGVPILCSDNRLAPCGSCRLCLVKVRGLARPVTACTTKLTDGREIETRTPQ